jgi:hypothetical protein
VTAEVDRDYIQADEHADSKIVGSYIVEAYGDTSNFWHDGIPSVTFPANRQPIVETLSVQVDVSPPSSKLEAFVNYKSAGQANSSDGMHSMISAFSAVSALKVVAPHTATDGLGRLHSLPPRTLVVPHKNKIRRSR